MYSCLYPYNNRFRDSKFCSELCRDNAIAMYEQCHYWFHFLYFLCLISSLYFYCDLWFFLVVLSLFVLTLYFQYLPYQKEEKCVEDEKDKKKNCPFLSFSIPYIMFKSMIGKISRTGRKLSELTGAELQVFILQIISFKGTSWSD